MQVLNERKKAILISGQEEHSGVPNHPDMA